MHNLRDRLVAWKSRRRLALILLLLAACSGGAAHAADRPPGPARDPFEDLDLPDEWEDRFWDNRNTKAILAKAYDLKELAKLVPQQAGIRFCRCPSCDAAEADDPLSWSAEKPGELACKRCKATIPNDKIPAKGSDGKVPEEVVEVLPRVFHHYPYHVVEPEKQLYPDERLYLAAKRDYEAREYLAKVALYAAIRHHERPGQGPDKDGALARLASVLVLRFAQVYPAYATHYDQPGEPKFFQRADLGPPYRRGYRTAKWDWTASLDVPLNLVIAYALLREDPALAEAGKVLDDPNASRTIERDLFRASAEFVRLQPEEYDEVSLQAYRGMLAVGRLLNDPALLRLALERLGGFAERGFYHDGFWRQGNTRAHRRVLALIDGWIDRLVAVGDAPPDSSSGVSGLPMLALAHSAGSAVLTDPRAVEIQQASWPPTAPERAATRRPALLGGVGLAHLAVGQGADALDLQLCGEGSQGAPHFQRQAIRLGVGGRLVLGDLDDLPPTASGWDRATASHNTVVVDGLNQRESPTLAGEAAPGGNFAFFAADPDFQVVALDDPRRYPRSTTRYRQTLVAAAGRRVRYALGVFEVHGGLQHDQIVHAAAGSAAHWQLSVPTSPGPHTLLPASIAFLPESLAEEGRWFVQAYGEFRSLAKGELTRPAQALLTDSGAGGVRLHLLGNLPLQAITADSTDPSASPRRAADAGHDPARAALILRRQSVNGSTLKTTFVTVYEPVGAVPPLRRVGRVASGEEAVVIYLETAEGPEHVIVNLTPGTPQAVQLADGQGLTTDAVAVRVAGSSLTLAGGTFAALGDREVRQAPLTGRVTAAVRQTSGTSRGWFETDTFLPDPAALAGATLLIHHGDGTTRGWTLQRVEAGPHGARLFVREDPGFRIDLATQEARYIQFPRLAAPGPHRFAVTRIARGEAKARRTAARPRRPAPAPRRGGLAGEP